MPPKKVPVSRRDRPAKPPLSREAIVSAAMAILAADGAGRLTMRRLATELDTGPASLYVYVRNMTELNALLIDRLLAEQDLRRTDLGWRERIHGVLGDYSDLLARVPDLARSAQYVWPDGPHYLDLVELLLQLLDEGGVTGTRAALGVDLLLQQATAAVVEWRTRSDLGAQDLEDLVETLDSADEARHPRIHALGSAGFVAADPRQRRAFAVDALIDGISTAEQG